MEGESDDGDTKLEDALRTAADACSVALDADRDIVEEEVAFLQDEYDQYSEQLAKVKAVLEGGIVKWTDYQEAYQDALDYLVKTEEAVKNSNKFQTNLADKRKVLEDFQVELQKVFDWQKELDSLNKKGQTLLKTCADSRVSNAITQLSTKYQALISLAKDVMRRLEMYFQEHHQHNALFLDCRAFIDATRKKLSSCRNADNTHEALNQKLHDLRDIRQSFEQGQNKLRYVLELKERIVLNTEATGAEMIEIDTSTLKLDFESLVDELQEVKSNLSNRFDLLGDIDKSNRLLMEWIEDAECKCDDRSLFSDLGEKRANLEKNKLILAELETRHQTVAKLEQKLRDHPNIPNKSFSNSIARFYKLKDVVKNNISALTKHVEDHEAYRATFNEASDWIRKLKIDLQQHGDTHGNREEAIDKHAKMSEVLHTLQEGDTLIRNAIRYSANVQESTNDEGRDIIQQDDHQLKYEWDQVRNQAQKCKKKLDKCIEAWSEFEQSLAKMNSWLVEFQSEVEAESQRSEATGESTSDDLERRRLLLRRANKEKYEVESLNDKCETLMEHAACAHVRDRTVSLQAAYTNLYTQVQGLLSKAERAASDHTDFQRSREDFDEWYGRMQGTFTDITSSSGGSSHSSSVVKESIDQLKSLMARMTEGQHLINCLSASFAAVASGLPDDQLSAMRSSVAEYKKRHEELSLSVTEAMLKMQEVSQRWADMQSNLTELQTWVSDTKITLQEPFDSNGELGEMKTLLARFTNIIGEIEKKRSELNDLDTALSELVGGGDDGNLQMIQRLNNDLNCHEEVAFDRQRALGDEIQEYNDYQQAMQETEKWLLQMSFQLMAHNSMYISTRDQTREQIDLHEKLMDELRGYQITLDGVREKGNAQIARYVSKKPNVKVTVDKQHQNFQESYNSLLQTGTQIKNRLIDSLAKFQEYEDALDTIVGNLEALEPKVKEDLDKAPDNSEDFHAEFENVRVSA